LPNSEGFFYNISVTALNLSLEETIFMRIVFVLLLFYISIVVSAQSRIANQVKGIFDDASKGFQKYIGTKKYGTDTTSAYYNTTIIIEGTTDNDIFKDSSGHMYSAPISDWVTKKEAKNIAEEWVSKLKRTFGAFKQQKEESFLGIISIDYIYRKESTSLSIDVVSRNDGKMCIVVLHISYYP
jgi:hypothetical protein